MLYSITYTGFDQMKDDYGPYMFANTILFWSRLFAMLRIMVPQITVYYDKWKGWKFQLGYGINSQNFWVQL